MDVTIDDDGGATIRLMPDEMVMFRSGAVGAISRWVDDLPNAVRFHLRVEVLTPQMQADALALVDPNPVVTDADRAFAMSLPPLPR